MRTPYFLVQTISILAFGLISCSSEKTSEEPDPVVTTKAEIQNTDETIQKIIGSKTVKASANISLEIEQGTFTEGNILASVECKTNFHDEVLTKDTVLSPTTNIHVKNILPPKVFSPTSQENPSVKCDMRLDVNNEADPVVIKLVGVKVLETQKFSNIEYDFISEEKNIQFKKDLSEIQFNAPLSQGEVDTLCEGSNAFSFINESTQSLGDHLADSLFEDKNTMTCRLLFRDDKTSETWVTKVFKVQNIQAQLNISSSRKWPGHYQGDFFDTTPVVYTLSNDSTIPVRFTLEFPVTSVTVTSVYKQGLTPNFWVTSRKKLPARWETRNIGAPADYDSETGVFTLLPGGAMEIILAVDGEYSCSQGILGGGTNWVNCHTSYVHIGMEFLIQNFPYVRISQFEDPSLGLWIDRNLKERQDRFNNRLVGHWAPNRHIQGTCPKWNIAPQPKGDFSDFISNFYLQHRCD